MKISEENKKKLRKVRGVAGPLQDIARNTLNPGIIERGAYIQFGRDMSLYNLYEALLYAESYEEQGYYDRGSTQKAVDAVIAAMNKKGT